MVRMILFCWLFVLQNDKIFSQDYSMIWNGKKSSITKEFFNNNCNGKSFTYSWEDKQSVVTALSNKILTSKNVLTFTFGTNIVEFDARGEELDLNRGTRSSYGSGEHHSAIFTYRISGEDIIVDYTRLEYAGGGSRYGQIKTFSINEILNIMEISTNELRNLISIERIKFLQNNDLLYINNKFLKMNESHSFWDLIEGGRKDLAVALKIPNNDFSYLNDNGETPLHYGAKSNELSLVKKLITKGVDIDERDFDGNTPLSLALKNNANEELISLLTNKSNERCSYALFSYSIRNGNINLINRCIDENTPYDIYQDNIDYQTFKYEILETLVSNGIIDKSIFYNKILKSHFNSIINNKESLKYFNDFVSNDNIYILPESAFKTLINKDSLFSLYVQNDRFKELFLSDDKYELYGVRNDVRLTLLSVKPLNRSIEYIDRLVDPESENFDYIIDKMILNTIFTNKKELNTHLINKKFEYTKNPSILNDYNYNNILYECLDRNFITNSKLLIENYNFDDTVLERAKADKNAKVINRLNKILKNFPNKKNIMTTNSSIDKEKFRPEYALNNFQYTSLYEHYAYDKNNKLAYKKSKKLMLKFEREKLEEQRKRLEKEKQIRKGALDRYTGEAYSFENTQVRIVADITGSWEGVSELEDGYNIYGAIKGITVGLDFMFNNMIGVGAEYQLKREITNDIGSLGKFGFTSVYGVGKLSIGKVYGVARAGYALHSGDKAYSEGVDLKGGSMLGLGVGFKLNDNMSLEGEFCGYAGTQSFEYYGETFVIDVTYVRVGTALVYSF